MGGWIGVDLDGTLAHAGSWQGLLHIGEPIPLMQGRVKQWLRDGFDVRIFTARANPEHCTPEEHAAGIAAIERWCEEHLGAVLPITHCKDYQMLELYDDRAVRVEKNTGRITTDEDLG